MGFKSGFATIVGRTNVGKSTLLNKIIGQKIVITSDKPQTTRQRLKGVFTNEEGQIVFIDTPGIHKPKYKLGEFLVEETKTAVPDADVILFFIGVELTILFASLLVIVVFSSFGAVFGASLGFKLFFKSCASCAVIELECDFTATPIFFCNKSITSLLLRLSSFAKS